MTTVSIVYQSTRGHTEALARALARGAQSVPDVKVHLMPITADGIGDRGRWWDDTIMATLDASDAIILGSPTLMGSAGGLFKLFMEAAFTPWLHQRWKDKLGSAFTNSASQSGDKLQTLTQLAVFGAQMGLLWVPVGDPPGNNWSGGSVNDINQLGSWMGVMGQSNGDQSPEDTPSEGDRATAERHGRRMAEMAQRWQTGTGYTTEPIGEQEGRKRNAAGLGAWGVPA